MAYPYGSISTVTDGVDDVDATAWNELVNALNDLLTELGNDPSGSAASVEARVDAEHADDGTHGAVTATSLSVSGNATVSGNLTADALLGLGTATELTIASGAITITGSYHTVDTEGDASSDDLDTINGGSEGNILVLRAANGARTVVLKDGTGNLQLAGDFSLDSLYDTIMLVRASTNWLELSRSNNT